MSDFSRAGWFDNTMNQAVTEQIVKEARYRNAAMATDFAKELAELDALDRERAASSASSGPTLPPPASGADAPVAAPEPEPLTQWERDNRMANEIGRSIWKNGNARYDPGTMNTQAHYKSDYVYDPDEVEPVDKTHFRRRDTFTNYVEAAARMKSIHGSKKKMMM